MTVLDEAKKLKNRLFINTYITVDFIRTNLQNIIQEIGLGSFEIRDST